MLYSSESIHVQRQATSMPKDDSDITKDTSKDTKDTTKDIMAFNSKVWNEKKSRGLSLKDSIKMDIPDNLAGFTKDLTSMHNLE